MKGRKFNYREWRERIDALDTELATITDKLQKAERVQQAALGAPSQGTPLQAAPPTQSTRRPRKRLAKGTR